ncbi:YsnF/AvaK domain-containing protein [Microbacterium lacticum]|uniref:YsnF/AvaK domain-containing protein n=1 Tax=Microbacterium lacticum TaxID=33885 RepID=UPI001F58591D|nr:YsnF/AvaK domain-containing protein [Microbacterium lacticum]
MIPPADDTPAAAVVRHEEILHVTTETVPRETVRIEKYIVTERRTITADVRREEIRITRIPITDPDQLGSHTNSAPTPPLTIVLHEEQLTLTTATVPVETVTIRVTPVLGEHRVEDIVRREQIDVVEHGSTSAHPSDRAAE